MEEKMKKTNPDITTFLAVEAFVNEKMFSTGNMKVIKDTDLAGLFEVDINKLRKKVKSNMLRFPPDFMVTLKSEGKDEFAFAEGGILMLGGLLDSDRAIKVHMQFIEYFVHLTSKFNISVSDILLNRKDLKL